jgi:hypothetical protein
MRHEREPCVCPMLAADEIESFEEEVLDSHS